MVAVLEQPRLWSDHESIYFQKTYRKRVLEVKKQVAKFLELGAEEAAEGILNRYRDRMFDLSAF